MNWTNFFWIVLSMPLASVILTFLDNATTKLGPRRKFHRYELLVVMLLLSIDDIGTAIGLQAEELPRTHFEGTENMTATWDFLKERGIVSTDTSAMRLIGLYNLATLFLMQYYNQHGNLARMYIFMNATLKAWAGSSWWNLKPNKYGLFDYLTFRPGRDTYERRSAETVDGFNLNLKHKMDRLRANLPETSKTKAIFRRFFPNVNI